MFLLHRVIGVWPALAGLAATIVLVPLTGVVGKVVHRLRTDAIGKTDARVQLISEIISGALLCACTCTACGAAQRIVSDREHEGIAKLCAGIKAIKLYAWEGPYAQRLDKARRTERASILRLQLVDAANDVLFLGGPILVAIAAFWTYVARGGALTADVAFPALAYFDLLRFPVIMLPIQVTEFINASVAVKRLQAFFNTAEVHQQSASLCLLTLCTFDFASCPV